MSSSLGLQTMNRTTASATTTISNRLLAFGPTPVAVEKILSVYNPSSPIPALDEVSVDELRNMPLGTDPPSQYAIYRMGASSVTIMLDCVPGSAYPLSADVESNQATLSGTQVPAFTESYHNLLVYGGMATELDKMEKPELAEIQENRFQQRLSEYRLFIAMSAYREIFQGKTQSTTASVPLV